MHSFLFHRLLAMISVVFVMGSTLHTTTPQFIDASSKSGSPTVAQTTSTDWPTYLANSNHTGFNSAETLLNATSAPHLHEIWHDHGNNGISVQPIIVGNTLYWGSWDGYMHAITVIGIRKWPNLAAIHGTHDGTLLRISSIFSFNEGKNRQP